MRLTLGTAAVGLLVLQSGISEAGVIGQENRKSLAAYAAQQELDEASVRQRFKASGRIMCPFGAASAFLVHKNDIVVTARHNLFPEKQMNFYAGRASITRCGFEVSDGDTSKWYEVDVKSFVYLDEAQRSMRDRFDWVAMRLKEPVPGVTPYKLPEKLPEPGAQITMVTVRQDGFKSAQGWNDRVVARCKLRHSAAIDKITGSGLYTDCSATSGASGGALLVDTPSGPEVVGVMSSTSRDCQGYDLRMCSSFAVGMYDQVRELVRKLSK